MTTIHPLSPDDSAAILGKVSTPMPIKELETMLPDCRMLV
jgi:hypothetical protein